MIKSKIVVFDAGSECLDRYTILPWFLYRKLDNLTRSTYLGMSEGGHAVSMWDELSTQIGENCYKPYIHELNYLGKRISFESLSEETRAHIERRIFEDC